MPVTSYARFLQSTHSARRLMTAATLAAAAMLTACGGGGGFSGETASEATAPPPNPLLPTHPSYILAYDEDDGGEAELRFRMAEKVDNSEYFYPMVLGNDVDEFLYSEEDSIGIWGYRINRLSLDLGVFGESLVNVYIRFNQPFIIYRAGMEAGDSIGDEFGNVVGNPRQELTAYLELDGLNNFAPELFEIFIDPSAISLKVENGWSVVDSDDDQGRFPGREYRRIRYSFVADMGLFQAAQTIPANMVVTSELELVEGLGVVSREVFVTEFLEDFVPYSYREVIRGDADGDEWMDIADAFPRDAAEWKDEDGNGVGDNADLAAQP